MSEERGTPRTAAIVLSAGRGSRMGADRPKQYLDLAGRPLISYALRVFDESFVDDIVLVCGAGEEEHCRHEIVERYGYTKVRAIVPGGRERYHSVAAGLEALGGEHVPDYVFIHDGARPFLTHDILSRAYGAVRSYGACVVGMPSKDTVKLVDGEGVVQDTPMRERVWVAQTPQVFAYPLVLSCYRQLLAQEAQLPAQGLSVTDDAMVVERFAQQAVRMALGSYENIKVTTPEDLLWAEAMMRT